MLNYNISTRFLLFKFLCDLQRNFRLSYLSKKLFIFITFYIRFNYFFTGFILNLQADSLLRNLRKDNNQQDYQILRGNSKNNVFLYVKYEFYVFKGGLSGYISSANFYFIYFIIDTIFLFLFLI